MVLILIMAPFQARINTDLGDVIKVNLAALPAFQPEPAKPEPIVVPQAIVADEPVAAIPDQLASVTEAKKVDKPKPKPKDDKPKEYKPDAQKGVDNRAGTDGGRKDVTGNLQAGSKLSGAAIDNASFDYPYWFVQAFSKVERNWTNPVYANQPLSCTVYFQVISSGRIIKIEIEQSSGIDAFDRACERAVKLSQPLPPLPDNFADEILGIHLKFPYAPQ
jgi:TonB family protein